MKLLATLFIVFAIFSCNVPKPEKIEAFVYKPKKIKRIYTLMSGHEIEGYTHYLTIENYQESSDNFLVDYADKYRDTCRTDLPIWGITFCYPFDFKPNYDSEDDEPLQQHSIINIGYQEETLHKKYPAIGSITFYKDGKPNYIQIMTLDRMKNENYYDSNGAYKRDWKKEFDKKFITHYNDTTRH